MNRDHAGTLGRSGCSDYDWLVDSGDALAPSVVREGCPGLIIAYVEDGPGIMPEVLQDDEKLSFSMDLYETKLAFHRQCVEGGLAS